MELVTPGLQRQVGNNPIGFLPSQKAGLQLWARFNSGIIETGLGISQWTDVSGKDNHFLQSTDLDKPQKQADGSILTDGVRQFLQSAFTLAQPTAIFLLAKTPTWANNDTLFDGVNNNSGRLYQTGSSPNIICYAGAAGATINNFTLDTYGVLSVIFDHDNSSNILQLNNNTPAIDTSFGTADMSGITLGTNGLLSVFCNLQVKEVVVYNTETSTEEISKLTNYLARVGGLSI